MVTPEIVKYVQSQLKNGVSAGDVAASLAMQGWQAEEIQSIFQQLGYRTDYTKPSRHKIPVALAIMLPIGLLAVIGVMVILHFVKDISPMRQKQQADSIIAAKDHYINAAFGFTIDLKGYSLDTQLADDQFSLSSPGASISGQVISGIPVPKEGLTQQWVTKIASTASAFSSPPGSTSRFITLQGRTALMQTEERSPDISYTIPLQENAIVTVRITSPKNVSVDHAAQDFLHRFHYSQLRDQEKLIQLTNSSCHMSLSYAPRFILSGNFSDLPKNLDGSGGIRKNSCFIYLVDTKTNIDLNKFVKTPSALTIIGNGDAYDPAQAASTSGIFEPGIGKVEQVHVMVSGVAYNVPIQFIPGSIDPNIHSDPSILILGSFPDTQGREIQILGGPTADNVEDMKQIIQSITFAAK